MVKLYLDFKVAVFAVWPMATVSQTPKSAALCRHASDAPGQHKWVSFPRKRGCMRKGKGAHPLQPQHSWSTFPGLWSAPGSCHLGTGGYRNPISFGNFQHFPTFVSLGVVLVLCSTVGPHLEALTSAELRTTSGFLTPSRSTSVMLTVPATKTNSSLLPKARWVLHVQLQVSCCCSLPKPHFPFCFSQYSKLRALHMEQAGFSSMPANKSPLPLMCLTLDWAGLR